MLFLDITEKIDLTGLGLDLENLSVDEELGVSGEITAMNIQQTEYRFCPMCSKDKEGFQTDANLLAYQTPASRAPSITLLQKYLLEIPSKILVDDLSVHIKNCLATSSKIYNSFISTRA